MNLIETFQNLVAHVPELVQPLIVTLAGAIPFIEGQGAVSIGIVGGLNPVLAAITAIIGNFLCVAILVLLSSGARNAVVERRRAQALVGADGTTIRDTEASRIPTPTGGAAERSVRSTARREKFQRAFERYGVPGVSLLGPLLLPTQLTATMLAAIGIGKRRILLWQAIAIIGWTTILAVIVGAVVYSVS